MSEEQTRHTPSIEEWGHRRVMDVPLDDDLEVKFRLPDLRAMISKKGLIPNPLLPIAVKVEDGGLQRVSDFDQEERQDYLDLQCMVIAQHLVEPDLIERFGSLEEAAEWVLEEMPPGHRERLWSFCGHVLPQEALATIAGLFGGEVASLDALAPFREDGSSDEPAGDLRAVGTGSE